MALLAVVLLAVVSLVPYGTSGDTAVTVLPPTVNLQNVKDIERVDKAITKVKNAREAVKKVTRKVEDVTVRETERIVHQIENEGKKVGKSIEKAFRRIF